MHIRYNETLDLWQYLSAVGPPEVWSTLPIDYGQITSGAPSGANIAYTNVANTFTENQTIGRVSPELVLNDTTQAANLKRFRIINASQNLYVQTTNDAGAGLVSCLQMNRSGDLAVGRDLTTTRNIGSGGIVSASSYISAATDLYGFTGIYERSRSVKVGEWTDFTPALYNHGSAAITINLTYSWRYMLVGKTCFLCLYIAVTNPAVTNTNFFYLPLGMTASNYSCNVGLMDNGTSGNIFIQSAPGTGLINIYRSGLINYPTTAISYMGMATIPVQ